METPTHIILRGPRNSQGTVVTEKLPAHELGDGTFRLANSPGIVEGIAAGDVVRVDEADHSFEILERGGNLAVRLYTEPNEERPAAPALEERIRSLGGYLDGGARGLLIFTIPVDVGFPSVEGAFQEHLESHPEDEWYFGNVYDPTDGVTPLDWWQAAPS